MILAATVLLAGKMAMFNTLMGARWTCTLGKFTYFASYEMTPGNTLHGHLYSDDSSEDTFFGFDPKRKLYWFDEADSTGETMSQTSTDGMTFTGTLNDGATTTKATNIYTITGAHQWGVRAQGVAAGQPYDVTATCKRS